MGPQGVGHPHETGNYRSDTASSLANRQTGPILQVPQWLEWPHFCATGRRPLVQLNTDSLPVGNHSSSPLQLTALAARDRLFNCNLGSECSQTVVRTDPDPLPLFRRRPSFPAISLDVIKPAFMWSRKFFQRIVCTARTYCYS